MTARPAPALLVTSSPGGRCSPQPFKTEASGRSSTAGCNLAVDQPQDLGIRLSGVRTSPGLSDLGPVAHCALVCVPVSSKGQWLQGFLLLREILHARFFSELSLCPL